RGGGTRNGESGVTSPVLSTGSRPRPGQLVAVGQRRAGGTSATRGSARPGVPTPGNHPADSQDEHRASEDAAVSGSESESRCSLQRDAFERDRGAEPGSRRGDIPPSPTPVHEAP